ncbi:unnamed protein product [Sphagnum troendelagicum]|uniref:Secreted protein n=1 Tax=Sphagnum troendelagicum TaxID=128251 RepID=A0ABP0TF21_9BRYO
MDESWASSPCGSLLRFAVRLVSTLPAAASAAQHGRESSLDDGTLEDDGEGNIEIRVHRPRSAHSFWRDLQH